MNNKMSTCLYIDRGVLETAKQAGLNISKVAENALVEAIGRLTGTFPRTSLDSQTPDKSEDRGRDLNPGARLHRPIGYQATSPQPLLPYFCPIHAEVLISVFLHTFSESGGSIDDCREPSKRARYDRTNVKPGGNILFIGTVFDPTLNLVSRFLGRSQVVFYGTTEGHSYVDKASLRIAKQIKIIAVSNFVRQMLGEIGISVADIVHHGLDMGNRKVNPRFYKVLRKKLRNKKIIFTVAANHSRKGLDNLLRAYVSLNKRLRTLI